VARSFLRYIFFNTFYRDASWEISPLLPNDDALLVIYFDDAIFTQSLES